jgi:hypothetical protein
MKPPLATIQPGLLRDAARRVREVGMLAAACRCGRLGRWSCSKTYRGEFSMKIRERWITVVLAISGGFFGAMLWAQLFAPRSVVAAETRQARTITAERIVVQEVRLVDPSGRQRAVLNVTPDDLARLSFLTTSGKRRLAMGVLADGESAVGLYDAQGRVRIGLNVPLDDSASVHLVDKTGHNRANFVQLPNGKSSFEIFNEEGHLVWSAPTSGAANSASAQEPDAPVRQASR